MPKGKRGCFVCGEPTTRVVSVWLREWVDVGNTRKERSVASLSRCMCEEHADLAFARALDSLPNLRFHGCGKCGARAAQRIQLSMRRIELGPGRTRHGNRRQRIELAIAASYCPRHAPARWAAAQEPLAGEWNTDPEHSNGDSAGLAEARKRKGSHRALRVVK